MRNANASAISTIRRWRRAWSAVAAGACIGLLTPTAASAQYFGQNKVQHDDFDFAVLETEHFDIYYYEREAEAATYVARMAERWHTRLTSILDWQLSGRQAIVIYASHPEFEQTNVITGMIDEATGGVTEGMQRRIVMPLAATLGETDHVLGHELVHAFQYDILGNRAGRMPLWVMEGMAEYLSVGPRSAQTAMWLRDAAAAGRLPTIDDLYSPAYFPYRFGHALWAYIGGRWGDPTVGTVLRSLAPYGETGVGGSSPDAAVEAATGLGEEELAEAWHESIRQRYGIEAPPEDYDPEDAPVPEGILASARADGGSLNVGPALSPDGSRLAFLSSRSRLSVDLYVADAATGSILRRLTRTSADPHFDSLQFLHSAGAWAADNRRLAVAAVRSGRGVITIFDTDTGRILEEYRLDEPGEVFHPAWSPDSSTIIFAAQVAGMTDLYRLSLDTGAMEQLTDDAFADLQPAWSPDGSRVAFVTDRFTSDLDSLAFGRAGLASLDPATGEVSPFNVDLAGDVISPQWTPAGRLLVISNATGRPEVYDVDPGTGQATRRSDVTTGVTGVTSLSPALSVAADTGAAAVSVFRDNGYEILTLDAVALAEGASPAATGDLASLPPVERPNNLIAEQLARVEPVPSPASLDSRDYSPGLSLVAAGQQLGASTGGPLGTYFTGGVSLLFSDVLGNHNLLVGADVNGGFKDIGGQLSYINQSGRWSWGVFGERVPLQTGYIQSGFGTIDGQDAFLEITDIQRQTFTTAGALVSFPFSRSLRADFSLAGQRIGLDRKIYTDVYDPSTGQFLFEDVFEESVGSLTLGQATAALVRDTTANGPTGPILGQRFRVEGGPTFGDLDFVDVTADFRQYAMPVRPLTLAGRALHLARYGSGAEDSRLFPYFLGYSTLVRGYSAGSFTADECTLTGTGTCPEFDRLFGSRIAVINAEARMPLLGFGGNLNYGPVPTEIFGFFDAGMAWSQSSTPSLAGGNREWVKSVGIGARVNVFGYVMAEFNLARPIDRPERGWTYVFNLRPGF